jgi:hypothetical protein
MSRGLDAPKATPAVRQRSVPPQEEENRIVSDQSYTATILVDQTPEEAFAAVNNVRGWWSGEIEGSTDELGAEFTYRYGDLHRSKQEITEFIPGKKVVWHVLDAEIGFVEDKNEWNGTDIVFEISERAGKTEVRFTHVGLVSEFECYDSCSNAWGGYITGSLKSLITTGTGNPNNAVRSAEASEQRG